MTKISQNVGEKPKLIWVPVDKIRIDRNYQREINSGRVAQILRDFTWEQFGAVMLTELPDGTYNCYDGQHRTKAASLHPDIEEVPATVVPSKEMAQEAGAFLGVNLNRTAVTPVERYWAGLTAGNADYLHVKAVLDKAGCEVAAAAGVDGVGVTNAVTAVSRAIKAYGDAAVVFACSTLKDGWATDKKALMGTAITALARLHRANPDMSKDRMVKVLRGADRLAVTGNAEALRKIAGGDAATNVAKAFCEHYNKGLQKGHIFIGARS